MGTTLSAIVIVGSQGFIAHVGDSRIYLARNGHIQQVTEDHTVLNELIKRGKLSREQIDKVQQKNAITRAVGVYERVEVDTLVMELIAGDTLILASDGLHGYLETPEELAPPLALEGDASVKALIDLANARGGKDNITTVVVKVGEEGAVDAERAKRLALKRDVLAHMPLFSRLTERELLRVMQAVEVREFADGELVIREGDKGDELFIVLEGRVRVSRGEQTLLDLGPGEHVGEMALIRSVPRSASVHALGAAELIAIRRQDFFEILRKEHEVAVKMLWQFLGVLADRLDTTSSELRNAKRELAAEDMTGEIFPEIDSDAESIPPPSLSR
jgi:CRP-like cAMP-binding protein